MRSLKPRLTKSEAQSLAKPYPPEASEAPYAPWIGEMTVSNLRHACKQAPQVWIGVYLWPDGMACLIPHPSEGQTLQAVLSEMYELTRNAVEKQVMLDFPPAGEA
jgi:hypothetical protein